MARAPCGSTSIRFVNFIWLGALIMFLGGLLSLSDRRYRVGAPKRAMPGAGGAGGMRKLLAILAVLAALSPRPAR